MGRLTFRGASLTFFTSSPGVPGPEAPGDFFQTFSGLSGPLHPCKWPTGYPFPFLQPKMFKRLERFERLESGFKPFQTFPNIFTHLLGASGGGVAQEMFGKPKRFERFESGFKPLEPFKPFKHFGVSKNLPGLPDAGGPPKCLEMFGKCFERFECGFKPFKPFKHI